MQGTIRTIARTKPKNSAFRAFLAALLAVALLPAVSFGRQQAYADPLPVIDTSTAISQGGTYQLAPQLGDATITVTTPDAVTLVGNGIGDGSQTGANKHLHIVSVVPEGANITLRDVKIINDDGTVVVDLPTGENTLTFEGTSLIEAGEVYNDDAMIHVPQGSSLLTGGTGTLYWYKNTAGAAFGAAQGETSGEMTFEDLTMFGKTSKQGAGIGLGANTAALTPGDITFNSGTYTLIGNARAALIGGGAGSNGAAAGGNVYINGGTFNFNIDFSGAAIGGGGFDKGNDAGGGNVFIAGGSLRTFIDYNAVNPEPGTEALWPGVTSYGVNDVAITATKLAADTEDPTPVSLLTFDTTQLSWPSDRFEVYLDGGTEPVYTGGGHIYRYINEDVHKDDQLEISNTLDNWVELADEDKLYLYAATGIDHTLLVNDEGFIATWNEATGSFEVAPADYTPPVISTVSVDPAIENGMVGTDVSEAATDQIVTLIVTPDTGYRLVAGSLKANGGSVAINGSGPYAFRMPSAAVTITAEFERIPTSTITIDTAIANGTVFADVSEAASGQTVTLTVTPDAGYRLRAGSLKFNGYPAATIYDSSVYYWFRMPDGAVFVTAIFEPIPLPQVPDITTQPTSTTVAAGESANLITFATMVTDGGVRSYQWYASPSRADALAHNGVAVEGATNTNYRQPATDIGGITYYYCIATNTLGGQTASVYSNVVSVTVYADVDYTATEPELDGDGYYLIDTEGKLIWFADAVNNYTSGGYTGKARLTRDLMFGENRYHVIGSGKNVLTNGNSGSSFAGTFDGQGHTITINMNLSSRYIGAFGRTNSGAIIKDLTIAGSIRGSNNRDDTTYLGGVVGYCYGATLTNVANLADVTLNPIAINQRFSSHDSGGITAYLDAGTITHCYNSGTVSGFCESAAGIAGRMSASSTIRDCYNTGAISSDYNTIGGSGNSGKTLTGALVGGITGGYQGVGENVGVITNTYNAGRVTAGYNPDVSVSPSTAAITVLGSATNSYYLDGSVSKPDGSGSHTTPKTVDEMRAPAFVDLLNAGGDAFVNDTDHLNGGWPLLAGMAYDTELYAISIDDALVNGTLITDLPKAAKGENIRLTVSPDMGYRLVEGSLRINGGAVAFSGYDLSYTFTMPEEPVIITADFEVSGYFTVTSTAGVYASLAEALAAAAPVDTITLTGEYLLPNPVSVASKDIMLKGQVGTETITRGDFSQPMFRLSASGGRGSLTLEGITLDGGHAGTLDSPDVATQASGPIVSVASGTVTVGPGAVLCNNYNSAAREGVEAGGAIVTRNTASVVAISGGTIRDNYSTTGGALYLYSGGTLNMHSGSIRGNRAGGSGGGAVQSYNATLNIVGGTIADNTVVNGAVGSAIYQESNGGKINVGSGTDISGTVRLKVANAAHTFVVASPLAKPITYAANGSGVEGAIVARAATDYTLTAADAAKFVWDGTGTWYFKLDGDRIRLTATPQVTVPDVGAPGSGDYNGDGYTTIDEALLLVQLINNDALGTLGEAQFAALDISADGELTMADALLIVQIILKAP